MVMERDVLRFSGCDSSHGCSAVTIALHPGRAFMRKLSASLKSAAIEGLRAAT